MSFGERRVVITGLGAVTPIGIGKNEFWSALERGANGARRVKNVDLLDCQTQMAAEVDLPEMDVLKENFTHKKMIKRLDRYVVMGSYAGVQAVRDSGLDIEPIAERVGTIIASGEGGLSTHLEQIPKMVTRGAGHASPFYVTNVIPNTATAFLSQEHHMQGPSFSVNSACASSNNAIGLAVTLIKTGMADVMFAGGAEAVANLPSIAAFTVIGALSARNDDPATASRPFDKDRDGFVMGEGAGVLCLEELEHAKARGAHIYAELTGFGFTSDAYDLVAPHPEGKGAARAMSDSMKMSGINPEDVGLINCHGTSTPMGDMAECRAINRAFGAQAEKVLVHSTKSMIGHLIGAASAVEAIAALMVFEKGIVHRTINQFSQDPDINLTVVKETTDGRKIDHILSNAFGFGGHNACVTLSRFKG